MQIETNSHSHSERAGRMSSCNNWLSKRSHWILPWGTQHHWSANREEILMCQDCGVWLQCSPSGRWEKAESYHLRSTSNQTARERFTWGRPVIRKPDHVLMLCYNVNDPSLESSSVSFFLETSLWTSEASHTSWETIPLKVSKLKKKKKMLLSQ